jgi:hypothetical protein
MARYIPIPRVLSERLHPEMHVKQKSIFIHKFSQSLFMRNLLLEMSPTGLASLSCRFLRRLGRSRKARRILRLVVTLPLRLRVGHDRNGHEIWRIRIPLAVVLPSLGARQYPGHWQIAPEADAPPFFVKAGRLVTVFSEAALSLQVHVGALLLTALRTDPAIVDGAAAKVTVAGGEVVRRGDVGRSREVAASMRDASGPTVDAEMPRPGSPGASGLRK